MLDSAALLEPLGASIEVGDLPVVHADPDDMYSVLQNLVTNSVKFARPDVPAVVRIAPAADAGGWRISVRDNGVGIPEHRRVDVFSLFSRVDDDVAGHGIGLATVARIIAAHGGRVGAERCPAAAPRSGSSCRTRRRAAEARPRAGRGPTPGPVARGSARSSVRRTSVWVSRRGWC